MKTTKFLIAIFFLTQGALSMAKTLYDFNVPNIDSKEESLKEYKGKVVLVVNTASRCGFTPQYKSLEALHEKYKARGFLVLGFPSNDFGAQEPGTNSDIKKFCDVSYHITFPLYSKAPVTGEKAQPVFAWLTNEADPKQTGPVKWNFEKFLIDKNGKLVKRYPSKVTPEDSAITNEIEALLKSSAS